VHAPCQAPSRSRGHLFRDHRPLPRPRLVAPLARCWHRSYHRGTLRACRPRRRPAPRRLRVARRPTRFGRRPRHSHRPDRGRRPAPLLRHRRRSARTEHGRAAPALGDTAGLDIRGEGGYVVAPPSSHRSGNRYLWLAGTAGPAPLRRVAAAITTTTAQPPVSLPAGSASERYVATALRREPTPSPARRRPTQRPAEPLGFRPRHPRRRRGTDPRRRDHRPARRRPRRRLGLHRGIPHHRLGTAGRMARPAASSRSHHAF